MSHTINTAELIESHQEDMEISEQLLEEYKQLQEKVEKTLHRISVRKKHNNSSNGK